MAGLMSITIAGNVGPEPEYHTDGTARLSFRVAVNTWSKQTGEQTTWFGVTAWGNYAESLHAGGRLTRGVPVVVSGQLQTREYTDRNGKVVTALDIRPDSIQPFAPKGGQPGDDVPF